MKALAAPTAPRIILAWAAAFFAVTTWTSYARWVSFEYRTFDLAYYVQAVWQFIHGRFEVSVLHAPLLGNHVEPIVFLFAPLFALVRHPMLFVVVQNGALAAMAPIGYQIARRLGFDDLRAVLLGAILLVTPATGYVALHEFHPEALTAPFLLLLWHARLTRSLWRHWIWFMAVLACKENMALLLAAYGAVNLVLERRRGWPELRRWYFWPMALAILWFALCSKVITPAFNSGSIDYLTLYDRLGASGFEILRNAVTRPQLIGHALFQSLTQGNLLWALLFPFLGLPLLRPRWLIISAPILLQHLLSWRSSEWTVYFHYAAPLLPLFWMATVETLAKPNTTAGVPPDVAQDRESAAPSAPGEQNFRLTWMPVLLLFSCIIAQAWVGPAAAIGRETADWSSHRGDRLRKAAFLREIPAAASVVAPLPYLSHLALREKLYSLHFILKGLKTLSHASYEPPPPTDYVFIDYGDDATFDAAAGYYHPAMQTKDGRVILSSEQLFHDFLKQAKWQPNERDELCLLRKRADSAPPEPLPLTDPLIRFSDDSQLLGLAASTKMATGGPIHQIDLSWNLAQDRTVFPWMLLRLSRNGRVAATLTKGLCLPEGNGGGTIEVWQIAPWRGVPAGTYSVEAIFLDNAKRAWLRANGRPDSDSSTLLSPPVSLGALTFPN